MDAEEKLVWLGIKTNAAKQNSLESDVKRLQNTVGDWDEFTDLVTNQTDTYDELRTELVDTYGWTGGSADALIARLQNEFNSYEDFQTDVMGMDSYEDLQELFDTATVFLSDALTEDGGPAAGIRMHESDGVSYSGVNVPAGTTEVFGARIEFSQQDPPRGTKESVTFSNMQSDDPDDVVIAYDPITFSADVTNPNGFPVEAEAPLTEDGSVIDTESLDIAPNTTVTVEFEVTKEEYICAEYAIGDTDPILACWRPPGL